MTQAESQESFYICWRMKNGSTGRGKLLFPKELATQLVITYNDIFPEKTHWIEKEEQNGKNETG